MRVESVTREFRKPRFKLHSETRGYVSGAHLPGFGYTSTLSFFRELLFKMRNVAYFVAPLSYNPNYLEFIERLKKKGFIQSVSVRGMYHDYPKIVSYIMSTGEGNSNSRNIHASSMVFEEQGHDLALSKVLGELLERDAARYPGKGSKYSPRTRMKPLPFLVRDIPHFSPAQHVYSKLYTRETDQVELFRSVLVKNLITRKKTWLPLQCVYYGSEVRDAQEKILYEPTTSGCGGGFTFGQAALSALFELIERDHFMLWWFSGLAPQRICIPVSDDLLSSKIREAQGRYGLEVYFLNTSYDMGILSVVCVIIDPILSIVGMGGKAGVSSAHVLEGAFVEALTMLHATRGRIQTGHRGDSFFKPNNFTDMDMHQMERETQCCTPAAIQYLKKTFLSGLEVQLAQIPISFNGKQEDAALFKSIVKRYTETVDVACAADHIFLYEFDSRWLRECNYHVVRVCIPSFLKLHLREGYATPYSKRLTKFCAKHGLSEADFVINSTPHFFP